MARQPMNMIELCNLAWDRKSKFTPTKYYEKTKNLLSHAFVDYAKLIGEDATFYAFQHIIVFFMLCDNEFLRGEYDCYKTFCQYAKYEPLSSDGCRALYNRLTLEDLTDDIAKLANLRDRIDPENYEAMVQGFTYFCLTGDKCMDENEYYILRCFFEPSDYAPDTWDQFKREW